METNAFSFCIIKICVQKIQLYTTMYSNDRKYNYSLYLVFLFLIKESEYYYYRVGKKLFHPLSDF